MKINLKKIPKGVTIIEGFPGFGLVGTISTEFLIEHLKAELIGEFEYDDLPATAAIHKGKLVKPMAVFYDKKNNLVILHTILNVKGHEWKIADAIADLAKKTKAKEIISLEGVASMVADVKQQKIYTFGSKHLHSLGQPISESIIVGVTAALMLKHEKVSCIFAGTSSQLPDSKAAASVIEVLDKHLGLAVDTKPLLKQADEFEKKLKGLMKNTQAVTKTAEDKSMSYFG